MIYPEEYTDPTDHPDFGKITREEEFFYRFKNEVSNPPIVFHRLILKFPGVNEREIDFLVLASSGVYIIELKNSLFRFNNGSWEFYFGKKNSWEAVPQKRHYTNPLEQVDTICREFIKFIRYNNKDFSPVSEPELFGLLFLLKNDSNSLQGITQNPQVQVYTKEKLQNRLSWMQSQKMILNEHKIETIKNIILNNANYFSTFERRMESHNKKIIALTKEQFQILEELENPKLLLSGVAGSGKTLIALEAVRMAQKKGWKTLFICRSGNLNKYLKSICRRDGNADAEIATMAEFCNTIVRMAEGQGISLKEQLQGNAEDYLREKLPGVIYSVLDKITIPFQYDLLIVDEAQDIMSPTELCILDAFLKGGFTEGKWLVCYDEEQALFGEMKEGLDFLNSFSPVVKKLKINKRTPRNIFSLACRVSGKQDSYSELTDFSTIQFHPYENVESGKSLLFQIVHYAVTERFMLPEDIIILSPKNKSNTESIGTMRKLRSPATSAEYTIQLVNDGVFNEGCVGFSEIQKFKGMERKFVILTGLEDFQDPSMSNLIYVGMTRATHMLALLYPVKASAYIQNLVKSAE